MQQAARLEDRREDGLFQPVEAFGLGVDEDAPDDLGFSDRRTAARLAGARAARTRAPQPKPTRRSRLVTSSGPRKPRPT